MSVARAGRALLLIAATIVATEWVHHRIAARDRFDLSGLDSISDAGLPSPGAITEAEFEAYVRILESIQADHGLTVADAAAREQVTLERFRDYERRVQRDPTLVERTRESLRRKAENLWDQRRAELAPAPPAPSADPPG